jgi:hypothetical protein
MLLKKSIPALLLGLALVAGCDTLGLGGDNSNDTSHDRIGHDRNTRVRDRGDNDGTLMKYPSDFDNGVPSGAKLAREIDTNGGVSYKAAHDGKLYVYDVDARRVAWSGNIRDGERFTIDSQNGRATLNGENVQNRDINPDHQYRLYFLEDYRANDSTR